MSTTMRLVDPVTSNELLNFSAYSMTVGQLLSLDVGFPTVRAVTTPIAGAHGQNDTTKWMGERAITATFLMPEVGAGDTAVDTLAGYMNPGLRLYMYVKRDGWASERRILVRAASFTAPPGAVRQAQCGWVAPFGLFEDAALSQITLAAAGGSEGGQHFPMNYPKNYGQGTVPGYANVTVGGTVDAAPKIDIYGPCLSPSVQLVGTGQKIVFTGLTITSGNFLRVDLAARTAFLNGDPTQSRYGSLDFTASSWWTLPPGKQQLLFNPQSPGPGCVAVVSWRNRTIAA